MPSSPLTPLVDDSPVGLWLEKFRALAPEIAEDVVLAAFDQLSPMEQAALELDWSFWARSKQLPPACNWRSWGFLTGRGFGKTLCISKYINGEVSAGRAKLVCLLAQDEQSSLDIQVHGPSGLIATAAPWERPAFVASEMRLEWPNGSCAYVRTPEVPGKIRGLEYMLTWASELQSWPTATRQEAWDNVEFSTRLGYQRIVWDATAKRRHPILTARLAEAEAMPDSHFVVRGSTHENASNLGDGYVANIHRKYGGTARGREELLGEMMDDAEGALWRASWIDANRAPRPSSFVRRVVSIDPAVSSRKGSDTTGVVEVGLGADGRGYVLGNATGRHADLGAPLALDWYVKHECDLIVAETNKGGDAIKITLKLLAERMGLELVVLNKGDRAPARQLGKVFLREVYARGAKEERAAPIATAYEAGRVSHVIGADLVSLEDTLTTWEPSPTADSPGDLDALVHGLVEILDLTNDKPDPKRAFTGLEQAARQIQAPAPSITMATAMAAALRGRVDKLR